MPPPKFALAIAVEPEPTNMASLRMSADALTVLSSNNPVSFTTDGLQMGDGMVYKICEKDIRIIRKLGQGASSIVHKGYYIPENKFVAVKKINVFERETRQQMLKDLRALCDQGAHSVPGLVSFHGAYHIPESGQISIVLEYVDGGSLADLAAKVGRIPENVLSKMTAKILRALAYLHRKHVVHRDIKPANILVTTGGEPKITDFGISAFIDSTLAQCNTFLGTVTYMSPERINNQQYGAPADIWSLGLALVELATGVYPYPAAEGPLQLMIHVLQDDAPLPPAGAFSSEFRDFVSACLHKAPEQRATAEQLMAHPWITKFASDPVSIKSFMEVAFDPHDRLDEIAHVFAYSYYALLGGGPTRCRDLAPLYSDMSILSYNDEAPAVGPAAIMSRLHEAAQLHASFRLTHEIMDVYCQPLGFDGSALVNVAGQLVFPPAAGGQRQPFTEVFVLSQIQEGEYYVANQVFRHIKK